MEPGWRVELLGGLRVCRGEQVVSHFRTRKMADLLAYLAYFRQCPHPREVLIELLWPEADLDAGRHNLSVALSLLRQLLEPPGVPDGSVLEADRQSVRLNPAAVATDVAAFEAAMADAAAVPPEQRAKFLVTAAELCGGELLPGHYDDWIFPEQQRLDELYFQALRQLILHLEGEGDLDGALQFALRGVAANRLREEAHREVIRLYAAAGRPEAAVRQYSELKRLLGEELGAAPGAETDALVAALPGGEARAESPVPALPLPPRPAWRGIPTRDGEAPRTLPAPRSEQLEPVGGAVPLGSEFYVPRDADREFNEAIARRDSIVLVKGPRQVGKTSLLARGLQQAREAAGDHAGGCRVVLTHFQTLSAADFASSEALLLALAEILADQLDLETRPVPAWDPLLSPNLNFRRYLRREVLGSLGRRGPASLVWGLDEVDRLFTCSFGSEIFGLFRSWHDERALEHRNGPPLVPLAVADRQRAGREVHIREAKRHEIRVAGRTGGGDQEQRPGHHPTAAVEHPARGGEERVQIVVTHRHSLDRALLRELYPGQRVVRGVLLLAGVGKHAPPGGDVPVDRSGLAPLAQLLHQAVGPPAVDRLGVRIRGADRGGGFAAGLERAPVGAEGARPGAPLAGQVAEILRLEFGKLHIAPHLQGERLGYLIRQDHRSRGSPDPAEQSPSRPPPATSFNRMLPALRSSPELPHSIVVRSP